MIKTTCQKIPREYKLDDCLGQNNIVNAKMEAYGTEKVQTCVFVGKILNQPTITARHMPIIARTHKSLKKNIFL